MAETQHDERLLKRAVLKKGGVEKGRCLKRAVLKKDGAEVNTNCVKFCHRQHRKNPETWALGAETCTFSE
jgi:hypothetical protein